MGHIENPFAGEIDTSEHRLWDIYYQFAFPDQEEKFSALITRTVFEGLPPGKRGAYNDLIGKIGILVTREGTMHSSMHRGLDAAWSALEGAGLLDGELEAVGLVDILDYRAAKDKDSNAERHPLDMTASAIKLEQLRDAIRQIHDAAAFEAVS